MTNFSIADFSQSSSLLDMFFNQASAMGEASFLMAKRDGSWTGYSYSEAALVVENMAKGLTAMGLERGDRVLLLSENRPEWVLADLAIMLAGGITVPAYVTNTVENNVHVLTDSGSCLAIVSNESLAKKLIPAMETLAMKGVVTFEAVSGSGPSNCPMLHLQDCINKGESAETADRAALLGALARTSTACIIYTSGTGGVPRGVMTSHGAILSNVEGAYFVLKKLPNFGQQRETFLSFLPLSHSYEHMAGLFFPIGVGAEVYFAENLDKLVNNMAEVRPTIMTAVPRLYEMMRQKILRGAEQAGGLKEKLLHKALELGRKHYEGQSMSLLDMLFNSLLDKLVRKKVAARFGGRLQAFVSGGAPLNYDVGIFFLSLGVRILQGYGQTESAPVISVNRPEDNQLHTVGPALENVELRIADDGEICVRGELVMQGYWNNEEASSSTVIDGWLHTGDIGHVQEDGFICITDRKKDIIVNSGGDNISPQRVEGIINLHGAIAQSMVYGDKKPNLVAIIIPDADFAKQWKRDNGKPTDCDLATDEDFAKVIKTAMNEANGQLNVIEKVRRTIIVEEAFTIENAMLTPSLKIRRHIIRENYGEALEALYKK